MNIALVTTTITVPHVLAEYRRIGPDVEIIVAGDVTGPQSEIAAFCHSIDARYLSYEEQGRLGYAVHDIIGPRSIQRRNIATLEAIKSGADYVMTCDTDNAPAVDEYFNQLQQVFDKPAPETYRALSGWLNIGDYAEQEYIVRGLPVSQWHIERENVVSHDGGLVGVFSSLIFDDPDIGAIERLRMRPSVDSYWLTRVSINPKNTWAPVNSQATTYRRALAPLSFVLPGVGRFDDIWGGYIAQRVLQETDYHVAFGFPAVEQKRHAHDLIKDLEHELFGMRYTERFCDLLQDAPATPAASIIDNLDAVCRHIEHHAWTDADYYFLPDQTARFMSAWAEDVGRVL